VNRKERRQSRAQDRAAGPGGPAAPASDAATLYAQAANALQSGRLPEAETLLRRVLHADPAHADAHNWLGVVCQQKGDGGAAVEHLKTAVALRPASADFANNLGITELKLGDFDAAERSFEKALALNPRLAQAHYNLGLVFQKRRQRERAIACFRQAIALVPDYGNAQLMLGNALSETGQHDEAIAVHRGLAALMPGAPAPLFNLATAFKAARRYKEAAEVARQILDADPNNAFAHNLIAKFLWSAGRYDEAERQARRAVALDPKDAEPRNTLGMVLTALGRFDEATASLESALALAPAYPEAIYNLLLASDAHSSPEFAARIEAMLPLGPPRDLMATLHFALGKIYGDLGDYTRAFENYRAGNDLAVAKASFSAKNWNAQIDRLIAIFSPEFFAARANLGTNSRRPVFIFGMLRSGTTLVEQIIASHPEVAAGDELDAIPGLVKGLPRSLGTATPYPECVTEMGEPGARDLALEYLADLDRVDTASARVTDKQPFNFENLGLLALLFPRATFIHCRRNPMDTCLSCYFQKFGPRVDFSFNLENLGAYYRGYRRLMDHWRKVLPVPMLEVDYEDLVADQEGMTRRIIAHCGLDWDDRCLAFYKTERPVGTASARQVRQPMYKTAVKRWRNYEQFLGPLRAALEGGDRS
jgi:tetratricopeptide (TPR) repeat protein